MTPEDLAALLANPCACGDREQDVRALADALKQAWAERDDMKQGCWDNLAAWAEQRERADRTEQQRDKAEANELELRRALARVRALCEQPDVALLNVNVIRAAIDGGAE